MYMDWFYRIGVVSIFFSILYFFYLPFFMAHLCRLMAYPCRLEVPVVVDMAHMAHFLKIHNNCKIGIWITVPIIGGCHMTVL
jgi:predicted membrane-bound mannosyltransferase